MKRYGSIRSLLLRRLLGAVAVVAALGTTAFAQAEQCVISAPAVIAFNVTDISLPTTVTVRVDITQIKLIGRDRRLKLSVRANAANFTPPTPGAITWAASDVRWSAGGWMGGAGSADTLSSTAFREVALSALDAESLTNNTLTFTLAPKDVNRAGSYTLSVTWRVESQ